MHMLWFSHFAMVVVILLTSKITSYIYFTPHFQVAACGESGDWFEQLLENVSTVCNTTVS